MKKQIILITVLLSFIACKKEGLPKATEKGKNTFGCKIDGKIFVPIDVVTFPVTPGLSFNYDKNLKWLHLFATEPRDGNGFKRNITIDVYNLNFGTNSLNITNKALVVFSKNNQQDQYFETNATIGGTVSITRLDTLAHIISGTFSFNAALRPDNNKILSVTNGRFDISYKP